MTFLLLSDGRQLSSVQLMRATLLHQTYSIESVRPVASDKMAGVKLSNFPVEVTQAVKTGSEINIEFVTLPGHVDGPGSTIHFRFFEQGGEVHLGVNAHITDPGPGTQPPPVGPMLRGMYTGVAHLNWHQQSRGVVPNTGPPVVPPGLPPIAVPNTGQR